MGHHNAAKQPGPVQCVPGNHNLLSCRPGCRHSRPKLHLSVVGRNRCICCNSSQHNCLGRSQRLQGTLSILAREIPSWHSPGPQAGGSWKRPLRTGKPQWSRPERGWRKRRWNRPLRRRQSSRCQPRAGAWWQCTRAAQPQTPAAHRHHPMRILSAAIPHCARVMGN